MWESICRKVYLPDWSLGVTEVPEPGWLVLLRATHLAGMSQPQPQPSYGTMESRKEPRAVLIRILICISII